MPEISGLVDIGRSVEDVFAYLADPKNNLEWESVVVEMEMTTEGPMSVGSKGRRMEKFMGTEEGDWEITGYDENRSFAMQYESEKFIGNGRWDLESTDGSTRLSYRFSGQAKSFMTKLMMPIFFPMVRRQIKKDYGTLKGILESQG